MRMLIIIVLLLISVGYSNYYVPNVDLMNHFKPTHKKIMDRNKILKSPKIKVRVFIKKSASELIEDVLTFYSKYNIK